MSISMEDYFYKKIGMEIEIYTVGEIEYKGVCLKAQADHIEIDAEKGPTRIPYRVIVEF